MTDARLLDEIGNTANPVSSLLAAASAANTAAATSGAGLWVDVTPYEGDVLVVLNVGALTGALAGKLQAASDVNGTGAVDITGATFAAGTANTPQTYALDKGLIPTGKTFVGFVGTITTGPVILSVTLCGRRKYN